MNEVAQAGGAGLQTPPKRMRTARVLSVLAAILSVLGFLSLGSTALSLGGAIPEMLSNPAYLQEVEGQGFAAAAAEVGFAGLTEAEAMAVFFAFATLFVGFGAVICAVSFVASIGIARSAGNLEKGYHGFGLGLVGGIASILAMRFVSGILLIAASLLLRKQCIEDAGGAKAYYADGKKLGFMRFVEFACIAEIIMNVTLLLFVTRSDAFDGAWWINFVMLLMMAVTLWLIWNRKSHGREIILGMVAAYLVIEVVYFVATGQFDALTFLFASFWPIVMLLYFGFSKQARYTLSRPFSMESCKSQLAADEKLWNPKSLAFWRNLVLYFCIFSVVGHWMEWSVCWLIRWGIVPGTYDPNSGIWRDMLNPFFVYGAAFVVIGLILYPVKNWLMKVTNNKIVIAVLASFVVNTVFCAAIELVLGFTCNWPPDPVTGALPLWDYSNMAFNFMGQICLLNTTFFGVMATLMTWLVYPALEKAFVKIPKDIMNILTVVILLFFVLVVCMYVINLNLASLSGIVG